jgi:hypothetical protein
MALSINEFALLLVNIQLDNLKANTFGLEDYYPLQIQSNIENIYEDYLQRDKWIEEFLINKLSKANLKNIIWSESARFGNNQYIYKVSNGAFVYETKKSNYFEKVSESKPFDESIVIDFFGFFGLNHSKDSRQYLNSKYNSNCTIYDKHLQAYLNSVFILADIDNKKLPTLNHIIAAPKETAGNIYHFLRTSLRIINPIKSYKLNSSGFVSGEFEILL